MAFTDIALQSIISGIIEFILIFVICLLGAYVKDLYNKITAKDNKMRISKIIIATIVSSIIMWSLSSWMIGKLGIRICVLPWFISGTVGFEAMGQISKFNFWLKLARFTISNHTAVQDLIDENNSDSNNSDSNNNSGSSPNTVEVNINNDDPDSSTTK